MYSNWKLAQRTNGRMQAEADNNGFQLPSCVHSFYRFKYCPINVVNRMRRTFFFIIADIHKKRLFFARFKNSNIRNSFSIYEFKYKHKSELVMVFAIRNLHGMFSRTYSVIVIFIFAELHRLDIGTWPDTDWHWTLSRTDSGNKNTCVNRYIAPTPTHQFITIWMGEAMEKVKRSGNVTKLNCHSDEDTWRFQ